MHLRLGLGQAMKELLRPRFPLHAQGRGVDQTADRGDAAMNVVMALLAPVIVFMTMVSPVDRNVFFLGAVMMMLAVGVVIVGVIQRQFFATYAELRAADTGAND